MKATRIAAGSITVYLFLAAASGPISSAQAPATRPSETTYLSSDSPLGDLFDTPAAMEILKTYAPGVTSKEYKTLLRKTSLHSMSARGYLKLSKETLAQIDSELSKIPAPPPDPDGPLFDPPYLKQTLALAHIPKGSGKVLVLFNGRNLDGWDSWLGPANSAFLPDPARPNGPPIGLNKDTTGVFRVRTVDGAPAIVANGTIWGGLIHKKDFAHYHLRLEYKWGEKRFPENDPRPRNNGVLYHSYGEYGAFSCWMYSVEYEMIPGMIGGVNQVGPDVHFVTSVGHDETLDTMTKRRFMVGGKDVHIGVGFEFIQNASDPERPIGQWNTVDLYVLGDHAIQVLNGVPVMDVRNITAGVPASPLTHGRIQLQSEGAETFFRHITVQPIDRLPTIVAKQ